ncbi:PREDICTED: gibberellin-regulated protein 14 [Bactrocera latifrons]|uniref:gibberellin-regulated protein 14 n=1 Tax=Bactrocera latifrons TaxID=174628 RepID=UPI0008DD5C28|nr:PREDICTED: gibberellin-regulated protein 14 [Bactrocera latifrons]
MRGYALIVTNLCLAAVAHGFVDYELKCTKDEIGIRWPSYYSSSDYYLCNRVGGKKITMTCGQGEVFTFVLQSCTSPGRYIPAPPINILPTSSPIQVHEQTAHVVSLPKPLYPTDGQPPIIASPQQLPDITAGNPKPFNFEPPHGDHSDASENPSETKEESVKPSLPNKLKPSNQQLNGVTVPLPPTPEPTPPVVKKPVKPQSQLPVKKQPAAPIKKPTTTDKKKKPVKPSEKQAPTKTEAKSQKKPPTPKKPPTQPKE